MVDAGVVPLNCLEVQMIDAVRKRVEVDRRKPFESDRTQRLSDCLTHMMGDS